MRQLNDLEDTKSKISLIKSNKLLIGALALVLVAGMASPAFALTVDDFDTGAVDLTAIFGDTEKIDTVASTVTIGGFRTTNATFVSGGNDVMARSNNGNPANDDIMSLSSGDGTLGAWELTYNANGAGLTSVDMTEGGNGDRICVTLISADLNSELSIWITDEDSNSAHQSEMLPDVNPDAPDNDPPLNVCFLYDDFIENAGNSEDTDFADVDMIKVRIDGVTNGDYRIDLIGVPQKRVGGTVGSMSTTSLLVAGGQANMGLYSLALVGVVAAGAAIIYKKKSKKTE